MEAKLAVLVGCNYRTNNRKIRELRGCVNDVRSMHQTLITRFGFNPSTIEMMTDDPDSKKMPTGEKIKAALERMFDQAKPGDVLLFYFAGHGTKIPAIFPFTDKPESAIVPLDLNFITRADFRKLVNRLPKGATFMFLADSCYSGGLMDQEKEQTGPGHRQINQAGAEPIPRMIPFETILSQLSSMAGLNTLDIGVLMVNMFGANAPAMFGANALGANAPAMFGANAPAMFGIPPNQFPQPLKHGHGVLISGCEPNENSCEGEIDGKFHGLFSYGVQKALKEHPDPITNKQLVLRIQQIVGKLYSKQHPCLYCSDKDAHALFL
ncbi:hypothetical protein BUALT_Bualt12G0048700 [Buddleja alternifolia]|uniref:Peptidase C14 caspase domain-containing protein n=1 Tax=Buddleja alternifolia TaxID=168488 RepID=A0AAV6WP44_9LAMI|nr:hypothetical protein BUALT_Bualt12G0048700 [Buddleja alternifolia]